MDRVDEDDRVDLVERPRLPRLKLLDDRLGDPRDRLLRDVCAVHVGEVRGDLAGRQSLRRERDDQLVDAAHPPLALADDLRLERPIAVARHLELDLADLGQHRLRPRAVARVTAVATGHGVLRVTEVLVQLRLERGLEHRLRQPGQQPTRPDQLDSLAPRALDQLLRDRLVDHPRRRPLDRRGHTRCSQIRHHSSLSASPTASKSGNWTYTVSRTVPEGVIALRLRGARPLSAVLEP